MLNPRKYPLKQMTIVDKLSPLNTETGVYQGNYTVLYNDQALQTNIDNLLHGQTSRSRLPPRYLVNTKNLDPNKPILVYYGLSDTVDREMAKVATFRGYRSIQLLHEPQMGGSSGIINVGTEFIHLYEPIVSQSMWIRLNPFTVPDSVTHDTFPFNPFLVTPKPKKMNLKK
jgi:hypothetical protein